MKQFILESSSAKKQLANNPPRDILCILGTSSVHLNHEFEIKAQRGQQ